MVLSTRIATDKTSGQRFMSGTIGHELSLSLNPDSEPSDELEMRMAEGIVSLNKTISPEVMVPRVDIITIPLDSPLLERSRIMVAGDHSRIPVYRGHFDHIVGIVYARDVLRYIIESDGYLKNDIGSVMHAPFFVPETKSLEELLHEFQELRVHMAVIGDEHVGYLD